MQKKGFESLLLLVLCNTGLEGKINFLQIEPTDIIYNKPIRYNSGSIVFINNYTYARILVVVNKHNTDRVVSFWFIIYCRLVMYGNTNIKLRSVFLGSDFRLAKTPIAFLLCISDLSPSTVSF